MKESNSFRKVVRNHFPPKWNIQARNVFGEIQDLFYLHSNSSIVLAFNVCMLILFSWQLVWLRPTKTWVWRILHVISGSYFNYNSQTEGFGTIECEEPVTVCCSTPICAEASPNHSFIQRGHQICWHNHWNSMGWSCFQSLPLYACKSCEFYFLRVSLL